VFLLSVVTLANNKPFLICSNCDIFLPIKFQGCFGEYEASNMYLFASGIKINMK
jgi:hypothetical protein